MLLPLFISPLEQSQACQHGLEATPFIVRRLQVMEKAVRPKDPVGQPYGEPAYLKLSQDFETHTVHLYEKILEYLMRVTLQSSRFWAFRYGRDVFKFDDWTSLLHEINDFDLQCTQLARQITMDKIDQGIAKSNEILQTQSQTWKVNFENIQQKVEESSAAARQQLELQKDWQQSEQERACHRAFRLSPPCEDEKNRIPLRAANTCAWFLENAKFLQWQDDINAGSLWISARLGWGESVLAKSLIQERLLTNKSNALVTYFFFKDASLMQKKTTSALAGILH